MHRSIPYQPLMSAMVLKNLTKPTKHWTILPTLSNLWILPGTLKATDTQSPNPGLAAQQSFLHVLGHTRLFTSYQTCEQRWQRSVLCEPMVVELLVSERWCVWWWLLWVRGSQVKMNLHLHGFQTFFSEHYFQVHNLYLSIHKFQNVPNSVENQQPAEQELEMSRDV